MLVRSAGDRATPNPRPLSVFTSLSVLPSDPSIPFVAIQLAVFLVTDPLTRPLSSSTSFSGVNLRLDTATPYLARARSHVHTNTPSREIYVWIRAGLSASVWGLSVLRGCAPANVVGGWFMQKCVRYLDTRKGCVKAHARGSAFLSLALSFLRSLHRAYTPWTTLDQGWTEGGRDIGVASQFEGGHFFDMDLLSGGILLENS